MERDLSVLILHWWALPQSRTFPWAATFSIISAFLSADIRQAAALQLSMLWNGPQSVIQWTAAEGIDLTLHGTIYSPSQLLLSNMSSFSKPLTSISSISSSCWSGFIRHLTAIPLLLSLWPLSTLHTIDSDFSACQCTVHKNQYTTMPQCVVCYFLSNPLSNPELLPLLYYYYFCSPLLSISVFLLSISPSILFLWQCDKQIWILFLGQQCWHFPNYVLGVVVLPPLQSLITFLTFPTLDFQNRDSQVHSRDLW